MIQASTRTGGVLQLQMTGVVSIDIPEELGHIVQGDLNGPAGVGYVLADTETFLAKIEAGPTLTCQAPRPYVPMVIMSGPTL